MESDKLKERLEDSLKKAGATTQGKIDRTLIVSYLARLSEKEYHLLLLEVKRLRNGVWKPLKETKIYTDEKSEEKKWV